MLENWPTHRIYNYNYNYNFLDFFFFRDYTIEFNASSHENILIHFSKLISKCSSKNKSQIRLLEPVHFHAYFSK